MKKLLIIALLFVGCVFAQDDENKNINEEAISTTAESLIVSGDRLVEFRKKYYTGFGISTFGQLLLFRGLQDDVHGRLGKIGKTILWRDEVMQTFGILFILGGGIYSFIAFNQIGEAGEELQKAGEQLKNNN